MERITASSRKRSVSVSEGFFFSAVKFFRSAGSTVLWAFPFTRRSSRGMLGDAMTDFILTHTAVKGICRHIHSTHKVPACNVLCSPFPIELPEPRPVGGDRFPSHVLALSLSDLDALTLSLFELLTLQERCRSSLMISLQMFWMRVQIL